MFILKILISDKKNKNYLILNNRFLHSEYKKIFINYNCEIFFVNNFFLFLNIFNYPFFIKFLLKINFYLSKLFIIKN